MAKRKSTDLSEVSLPKEKADIPVYSAAKQVFRGRRIKNGQTLAVAVQAEDQIGQVFLWRIRRNAAGPKQIRCIEPNSSKIKAIGKCNRT